MKKRTVIALLLAVIMIFSSCSLFSGTPKPTDNRTVLKLDGEKINYDYYRYVFLNTKYDYDGGDDSFWASSPMSQVNLMDSVLNTLIHNRAIELIAEKYSVKLTSDEKKEVKTWYSEQKESLSDEEWENNLSSNYLTDYLLVFLKEFNLLWQKAYDYYTDETNMVVQLSDDELIEKIPQVYHNIMYVMISSDNENALEKAMDVKALADEGADFASLVKEYGDDNNMFGLTDIGYYYVDGEIISDVADAVSEMKVGEISNVIVTDLGCFVIKVLDIDMEYVLANLNDFRAEYYAYLFNEEIEEIEGQIKVEYEDLYSELTINTLK